LHGVGTLVQILAQRGETGFVQAVGRGAVLQRGDHLGQRTARVRDGGLVTGARGHDRVQRGRRQGRQVAVAALDHVADHAGQAHALAVFGRVDAGDAIGMQFADLVGHDHPAAAAEHPDVTRAGRLEQVDHVLEVLDVAPLVGADRDAVRVFLQRAVDDLLDRAVVPEMDHLAAHALQDAPHDVDRGIVAIEQRGGRDEAHLVGGTVFGEFLRLGKIGHGRCPAGARFRRGRWGWARSNGWTKYRRPVCTRQTSRRR
jgi:hypothetical protein